MDVQSGRGLPKNFRQIGGAEKSTKVYIEDYVYTFMRKLSEEEDISVGALIGNNVIREGTECVFISGMVKAADCVFSDDRVVITDNTWAAVFENVKKYFDGMTVCGWFVSSQNPQLCRQAAVSGIYNCGNKESSLIYIRDRDSDEDCVYRVTSQGKTLLSGYYIYYERNEQMQEYMIDTTGPKSVDPPPVNIMKRLNNSEKKASGEINAKESDKENSSSMPEGEKKKGNRTMYFAASLLLLSIMVLGYSIYQKGNGGAVDIPVFSNIGNMLRGNGAATEAESVMSAGIIVENAEGIISESPSAAEGQTEGSGEANISESVNPEETAADAVENQNQATEANAVQVPESTATETVQPATEALEQPQTTAEPAVNTGTNSTYTVQPGDTLTSICIKAYGKEDPVKIEEIKNLNGLESADYIFVGQILAIP